MLASIALAVALVSAGIDVAVAQSPRAYPSRAPASIIEPTLTMILATQATAPALSPVSNVQGAGFNRFVQIWLENVVSIKSKRDEALLLTHMPTSGQLISRRGPELKTSGGPRHSFDQLLCSDPSFGAKLLCRGCWGQLWHGQ